MDKQNHHEYVQKAVKGKFRGRDTLPGKTKVRYPESAEREYRRLSKAYMVLMNKALRKLLPEMMALYKEHRDDDADVRLDSLNDIIMRERQIIQKIREDLERAIEEFGLDLKLERIARLTKNASLKEWRRAVRGTLGIDITQDYYNGELYQQALDRWVAENISKIKTMPGQSLAELERIIIEGYKHGKTITTIQKEISGQYNMDKHKAQMLARDQLSTLNSQLTKMQQTDAGVKRYKWSSSKDSRVRDSHRMFDGKIFSWDDPPEGWYMTKGRGKVMTGRRCHPGEDYCCRCVAIPMFDYQTIDLPVKEE